MAYDPAKARVYNEARAQGLTEDQAIAAAGITEDEALTDYTIDEVGSPDPTKANYNPNYGQITDVGFNRVTSGAPDAQSQTIDPQVSDDPSPVSPLLDDGPTPPASDPQIPTATVTPVSTPTVTPIAPADDPQLPSGSGFATPSVVEIKNESSTQETVTGGGSTTTYYQPTQFTNTPASIIYQAEADRVAAEKTALSAQLKAEGLSSREILRDERYRALSREQNSYEVAAYETKAAVPGTGGITVVQDNGSGDIVTTYQPSTPAFVTENAGIEDPNVQLQEISQTPAAIDNDLYTNETGIDPYGVENDPFDPTTITEPNPALFTEEYVQEQDNPVDGDIYDNDTGISPYGEEDEIPDPRVLTEEDIQNEDAGSYYQLTEEEIQEQDNPTNGVAAQQQATLAKARAQAALQAQRKQANDGDWRVRLRLAPGATYLYKAPQPGILQPLAVTDGVVFPYTPQIQTVYKANYNQYDLTHSNYRGYFYQGSQVEDITVTGTFTAQDSNEANYLLAVIHFFRSATKMFYGQDAQRGAPPPVVFLQGFGEYQFNLAPCVIGAFNYNLPNDVDYIRAGSPNINGTSMLQRRSRQDLPTNPFSAAWSRIQNVLGAQGINKGAVPGATAPAPATLGTNRPTYVPTKMDISITLHPIQSRSQVSKQFSVKGYASGDLLKGGFW